MGRATGSLPTGDTKVSWSLLEGMRRYNRAKRLKG
jgi:hypothetical protein